MDARDRVSDCSSQVISRLANVAGMLLYVLALQCTMIHLIPAPFRQAVHTTKNLGICLKLLSHCPAKTFSVGLLGNMDQLNVYLHALKYVTLFTLCGLD